MNVDLTFVLMLDALLKSAALLLAGSLLLVVFRKASAANRHAILVAVLSAVLLLPFTKLIAPRWSVAMDSAQAMPSPMEMPAVVKIEMPESAPSTASSAAAASAPASPRLVIPWKALLVAVWMGGVALLLTRRLAISLKLRSLARSSVPIGDARLAALASGIVEASGTEVSARESATCRVPLVAGIVRPIVLLPADAREWDVSRVSFALCHELGHVRRRDCLTRLLADIACALYWLNPLVWLASRQLRIAQEQACDDLVLKSGAPADEYAGLLVETVRRLQSDDLSTRHAQPSTLETRVVSIMDPTRNRDPRGGKFGMVIGISITGLLALCAAAQLRAAPEPLSLDSGDSKARESQPTEVSIDAKVIKIVDQSADIPAILRESNVPFVTSPEAAQELNRQLQQTAGVEIVSTPRVLAMSGKKAVIKLGRDFSSPSAWEKDVATGKWRSTAAENQHLGIEFEVMPTVTSEGSIVLSSSLSLTELEDVIDASAPQPGAKTDPARKIPDGHLWQPVFDRHRTETTIELLPNSSAVIDVPGKGRHIVLLTARVVAPGTEGSREKSKEAPIQIESKSVQYESGVLQASGNVVIRAGDATIETESARVTRKNPEKAGAGWIYPKIEFREATLQEVADQLTASSRKLDPAGKGATVRLMNENAHPGVKVTLSLKNVPLVEVLAVVAVRVKADIVIEEDGYTLRLKPAGASAKANERAVPPVPKEASAPWKKASGIILPAVDFNGASVAECLEFFRARAKELDPAKQGVNLVLRPLKPGKEPSITLLLRNIPLSQALNYVAGLAGLRIESDETAITLSPLAN